MELQTGLKKESEAAGDVPARELPPGLKGMGAVSWSLLSRVHVRGLLDETPPGAGRGRALMGLREHPFLTDRGRHLCDTSSALTRTKKCN